MTSTPNAGCQCGCGEMTVVSSAIEPCGCGCDSCEAKAPKPRDVEIVELTQLRESIEKRLAELRAG